MGGIVTTYNKLSYNINNDYILSSIIGLGGFAIIREIQCKKTNKWYAIKEFNINKLNIKEYNIIKNELNIYKRITSYQYIITLYKSFSCNNNNIYFILDLLTGGDLRFLIRRNEQFNEKKVSYIIYCIGSALNFLHSHKIIHRDVKPENIVFDSNGIPKLVDFGMSYLLPPNTDICVCQYRSGTREYLAPESCVSKTHYHGYEVDFWSLGIILYELLFKKRPFECMVPYCMVKYSEETYKDAWETLIYQSQLPTSRRVTRTSSLLTFDILQTSVANSILSDSNISSPSLSTSTKSSQKYHHHIHQPHYPLDVGSFVNQNLPPLNSEIIVSIPQVTAFSEPVTDECMNILSSLLDVRIHKRIGVYERFNTFASHQWFINNGYSSSKTITGELIKSPIVPQLDEVSFQIWTQFYEKNIQNFQESVINNQNCGGCNNNKKNQNNNNANIIEKNNKCDPDNKLSAKEIQRLLADIDYVSPHYNDPNIITPEQPITYLCKVRVNEQNILN